MNAASPAFPTGLDYDAFLDAWQQKLAHPPAGSKDDRKMYFFSKYNWERAARVAEAFEPSRELVDAMKALKAPQTWIVLTEDWCGDSAFCLPVIRGAAALSPLVTLRILPRDQHLDVMDRYLTGGARGIPKLVVLGADGEEVFQWGPRPSGAVAFREQLVADGLEKPEIMARLTEWYEAGGWRGVEPELVSCLRQTA